MCGDLNEMKILVILGHPDPDSLNHAIALEVCNTLRKNGHSVMFHDLYAENFDPFLPKEEVPENGFVPSTIQNYCTELQSADGIVIIHPNWWGQPPAILMIVKNQPSAIRWNQYGNVAYLICAVF